MKITTISLIRNLSIYDFPWKESVSSALPFSDSILVNVGKSNDNTLTIVSEFCKKNPKVSYFESDWDETPGINFLSHETNKLIEKVDSDYIFLLQADEVINENDAAKITDWAKGCDIERKQGITFNYYHFEKAPNLVRKTYKDGYDAYDKEIRLFKNNGLLHSFGDGQSLAFTEDLFDPRGTQPALHHKERFLDGNLSIYHYGYLRDTKALYNKKKDLDKYYKISEPGRKESILADEQGNYIFEKVEDRLKPFYGNHPEVMKNRLQNYIPIEENNE